MTRAESHRFVGGIDPSGQTAGSVTSQITATPLMRWRRTPAAWMAGFAAGFALTMLLTLAIVWVVTWGVGVWGVNIPVAWGFAIVNFVWWIGIGHAGTLISAILLLLHQRWRNSINRFAEAMTLFAVANAGLFPLLHLGRIWKFYYLLPYPNSMGLWPQWRSPLVWDVVAVMTYGLVSLLFWYLGLVPDLATMRDTARRPGVRRVYGVLSLGWRGDATHWQHHQTLYLILAGLATPLVVSVHSIVSLDFAAAQLPGWHSTIFPPYFVAGAIYSGFAMVIGIAVVLRYALGMGNLVTSEHLDKMSKVMLVSGIIVAYGYVMEVFTSLCSGDRYEEFMQMNRMLGPYWPAFWATIACNVVVGQALWSRWVRVTPWALLVVTQLVQCGMWLERYLIVITSLHRDFLPSSWGMYYPTVWDWATLIGTVGLFVALMFLFVRLLPAVPMYEVRELLAEAHEERPVAPPDVPVIGRGGEHGLMAEYENAAGQVAAVRACRAAGCAHVEAFGPRPVEELHATVPVKRWLPLIVLIGAVCSAAGVYLMEWYAATVSYPWNIGGRPLHSWPSFIPLTFEAAVLGGSISGVVGLLVLIGLPRLHHPAFGVPGFRRASRDRFFVWLKRGDERNTELLRQTAAKRVWRVGP